VGWDGMGWSARWERRKRTGQRFRNWKKEKRASQGRWDSLGCSQEKEKRVGARKSAQSQIFNFQKHLYFLVWIKSQNQFEFK
jgi:hypothetical protein